MTVEIELRDTMGRVGEICVSVKYSPKRKKKMLGKLTENVKGTFDSDELQPTKLDKLCVTRWTFQLYEKVYWQLRRFAEVMEGKLGRKVRCGNEVNDNWLQQGDEILKFYFGLPLGRKLYAHTNNLFKTLQQEKMSAFKGKSLADLTVQILEGIRNDRNYNLFYESVEKSSAQMKAVSKLTLPRERNTLIYSILQFVEGHKSEEPHQPETAHRYFKAICNEEIDIIINSIQDRFEQPGFKVFGQVEQLFWKSVDKEDHSDEIMTVESTFRGDYDHDSLIT